MKYYRVIIGVILFLSLSESAKCQKALSNKDIAKRYITEIVNNRKLELLNEIFTDSFLVHRLTDSTERYMTIVTQKDFLIYLFKAFPDIHYTIGDIVEEGNKVVIRVSLTATHKDEFRGYKATGNRLNYVSEIFFFRFDKGRISESWVQHDLYTLYNKLKGE